MLGDGGQFVDQGVEDSIELGMHGGGVGLVMTECSNAFTQPQAFFGVADMRLAA